VTVSLWRVAADTPLWSAEDMAGKGAAHEGARWKSFGVDRLG
jgi:RES domain-containing protein